MIAYLEGTISFIAPTHMWVNVGGIGYEVKISLNTYSAFKEKSQCKVFTWLQVKEDSHTLFGFSTIEEKEIFLQLVSVSGIGAATALMVTSSLGVKEIKHSIIMEDAKTIQSIKGIGGKTAQRIILELKDKLKKDGAGELVPLTKVSTNDRLKEEALGALVTLGIPKAQAEKNIVQVFKTYGDNLSLEDIIKQALKTR